MFEPAYGAQTAGYDGILDTLQDMVEQFKCKVFGDCEKRTTDKTTAQPPKTIPIPVKDPQMEQKINIALILAGVAALGVLYLVMKNRD